MNLHQRFIRIYYNHHYYLHLVQHFLVHLNYLFIVLINDEYQKVFFSLLFLIKKIFFFIYLIEESDSPLSHRSQSHSNSLNHTPKSNSIHPTILSGDVTPSSLNLPPPLLIPSSLNESKDNDLLTTDISDDGNISDNSTNGNNEIICDDGPTPLQCDRG